MPVSNELTRSLAVLFVLLVAASLALAQSTSPVSPIVNFNFLIGEEYVKLKPRAVSA
jgi:hypothetical protein